MAGEVDIIKIIQFSSFCIGLLLLMPGKFDVALASRTGTEPEKVNPAADMDQPRYEIVPPPNEARLKGRIQERISAYDVEDARALYSMVPPYVQAGMTFEEFRKDLGMSKSPLSSPRKKLWADLAEICSCVSGVFAFADRPKTIRCVLQVSISSSGEQGRPHTKGNSLEMWEYINDEWYWGTSLEGDACPPTASSPPRKENTVKPKSPKVPKDFVSLTKRANEGDVNAQLKLGTAYRAGDGVARDFIEAARWFRMAAEQGNVEAQRSLAYILTQDESIRDYPEALKWYRKSAERGELVSQYMTGYLITYKIQGARQDNVEAVEWFRKAAEQGHAAAQINLGFAFFEGRVVPKNYAEALKLFLKGASKYEGNGGQNPEDKYFKGSTLPQDPAEKEKWYRLAAEAEYANANFYLGVMHYGGTGVPSDFVEAMRWYRMAADAGHGKAQSHLGRAYFDTDQGVPRDYLLGFFWVTLAESRVKDDLYLQMIREEKARNENNLNEEQRNILPRMIREWEAKHPGK